MSTCPCPFSLCTYLVGLHTQRFGLSVPSWPPAINEYPYRFVRSVDGVASHVAAVLALRDPVAFRGHVLPLCLYQLVGLHAQCFGQSAYRARLRPGFEKRGRHTYPSWLWPGSVVDELYDLSVVLASAFDWPLASAGNLWGSRPRSESAAWFILTGEVPQVRPIEARWEMKLGVISLLPQWRIQLTIPPWLPEEEVLRAFRSLRRERPAGHQMPKTAKPLEVARFVWKRKRVEYREPVTWTAWLEQWNEEHPGHRFSSASNLRTYFLRGVAAVKHLNFDPPNFELPRGSSDANRHHRERKTVQHAAR